MPSLHPNLSMTKNKKENTKAKLHPRSKHTAQYDFKALIASCPELEQFVAPNKYGNESIDFFNAEAVKCLNKALLLHHYNLNYWDIPEGYLCPPIPGRADYLHYVADLLGSCNNGSIPMGVNIKCLDVGTGANCIYPLIGNSEYNWYFVGSDIDPVSITSADNIISKNEHLHNKIECRLQNDSSKVLEGIIKKNEKFDLTICNPPFHSSLAEAQAGSIRKLSNLKKKKIKKADLNFGGQSNELWTLGGERRFILDMIKESAMHAKSVCWFSSLVSKEENLQSIFEELEIAGATAYETIRMQQGNKSSRIVAWTFLSKDEEQRWVATRWNQ